MKKRNLLIVIIIVLLVVAVAVLALLNRPQSPLISGQLDIIAGEDVLAQFSAEDIMALPAEEFEQNIVSGNQEDSSGRWTGVALPLLLDQAAPGWQEAGYTMVAAQAEDGYVVAFELAEAAAEDNVYACYLLDGQGLGAMDEGGDGPFRLVVRNDEFGTRCIRNLCQLELR